MKPFSYLIITLIFAGCTFSKKTDSLSSWKDSASKTNIIAFVEEATTVDSENYIPPSDRIVTIDNDGTMWAEQPIPNQLFFAFYRIKELAVQKPELREQQPYRAVIENDMETIKTFQGKDILQIAFKADAIENVDDFPAIVKEWLAAEKHPELELPFTATVYQPMLELLDYLADNEFQLYIVSGGSVEFMRAFLPEMYDIPASRFIGTTAKTKVKTVDGKPVVEQLPELKAFNDKEGKIISIETIIGKKPVISIGNSDGDLNMMEYSFSNSNYNTLQIYIHHNDEKREFYYDENTASGRLEKGMTEAKKYNWTIVSMKDDWKTIFATKQD